MAKSKNHTNHNQGHKNHRNGIKKPRTHHHRSLGGVDPKFLRNQRFAKKHNVRPKVEKKAVTQQPKKEKPVEKAPAVTPAKTVEKSVPAPAPATVNPPVAATTQAKPVAAAPAPATAPAPAATAPTPAASEAPMATGLKQPIPKGLTQVEVNDAVKAFREADKDNSGSVTLEELTRILIALLKHRMSENIIKRLASYQMSAADKDKSGTLDVDEFLQVLAFIKTESSKKK